MNKEDKLKDESTKIVKGFDEAKLTKGEGMVVLAMTLAVVFKSNGVSQHEAINRFATIVKNVYGGAP